MHPFDGVSPLQHEWPRPARPARVVVMGERGFVAAGLIEQLSASKILCRPVGKAEVDLVQPEAVERLRSLLRANDAVVFASALTPEHGRDRAAFLKNLAMADHLCAAMAETGCAHLVYISSDSVYGAVSGDLDEASCCGSNDLYALSHIVREKLMLDACQACGTPLAILRPTAIYGSGDTHNAYGPNRFVRSAVCEGKIVLFGRGEEERDHIYIGDLVQLIELCLLHCSSGILNAANGTAMPFLEIAQAIASSAGRPVTLETAARSVPIVHRRFRISNLRNAFPEFEPTPFAAGVRRFLVGLTAPESRDAAAWTP